jgi:hypothetical protein
VLYIALKKDNGNSRAAYGHSGGASFYRKAQLLSWKALLFYRKAGLLNRKAELLNRKAGLFNRKVELLNRKAGLFNRKAELLNRKAGLLNRKAELFNRKAELLNRKAGLLNRKVGLFNRKAELFYGLRLPVGPCRLLYLRCGAAGAPLTLFGRRELSKPRSLYLHYTQNLPKSCSPKLEFHFWGLGGRG